MKTTYPHEQTIDFLIQRLPQYRQEALERQKQADGFVVWVVALSSGAIALILSESSVSPLVGPLALKIAVGSCLLTIVSAVIFRAFSYLLGQLEWELTAGFEGFCSGYRSESCGPMEITEHHTIEQIVASLREDMGLDYDEWLGKDYLTRDFWVDHYNRFAEIWRTREGEGVRNLARALASLTGKKPQDIEALLLQEGNSQGLSTKATRFRGVCNWSFVLMMVFFVLSIAVLAIAFFAQ